MVAHDAIAEGLQHKVKEAGVTDREPRGLADLLPCHLPSVPFEGVHDDLSRGVEPPQRPSALHLGRDLGEVAVSLLHGLLHRPPRQWRGGGRWWKRHCLCCRPVLQLEEEADEVADGDEWLSVAVGQMEVAVGDCDAAKLAALTGVGEDDDQFLDAERRQEAKGSVVGLLCDAVASLKEVVAPAGEPGRAMGHAEEETEVHECLARHVLHRHCPGTQQSPRKVN